MGNVYETSEKLVFEGENATLPYRLIIPEGYDAGKKYPLLLTFHGIGERGNDNELQLFHCVQYLADHLPECFIASPQCPADSMWVDVKWETGRYSVDEVPESKENKAVIELIGELCERYSICRNRIYAAGLSMGGFGVWDLITRHNDIFAAGIAICGGGDASKAEFLKDTPMFLFHGDADGVVPISGSREMFEAIKAIGGNKIELTEIKGGGHAIWNDAIANEGLLERLLDCRK